MKNALTRLGALLAALSLALAAPLLTAHALGTCSPLLQAMLRHFAPPAATALPPADYPRVAEAIAGYLAGETGVFQVYSPEGLPLFHDYEQAHMADCAALFRLARTLGLALLGLCALLVLLLRLFARRRPGDIARGLRNGAALCGGALAALLLWALADFDGLFIRFHQTFFTNDLWLLNPQTDLLIRLMPIQYFIHCALLLLLSLALALTLTLLAARRLNQQKQTERSTPD